MPFRSQRFDPDLHNAAAFTSGERSLDVWLQDQAVAATDRRTARTWVWVSDAGAVVGYYALTAHKIARDDVPARIGRGGPAEIAAVLLARLALHVNLRGQDLGGVLLADALGSWAACSASSASGRGPLRVRREQMRSAVGQLLDFSTPRARVVLVPARPRADLLAYRTRGRRRRSPGTTAPAEDSHMPVTADRQGLGQHESGASPNLGCSWFSAPSPPWQPVRYARRGQSSNGPTVPIASRWIVNFRTPERTPRDPTGSSAITWS